MSKRVLVIGEKCIDLTWFCKCERLSPEKPSPVLLPIYKTETLGMAGNVYNNLKSLAPDWEIFWIHQYTPVIKTRYIDEQSNHYFFRVDENDIVPEHECLAERDFDKFLENFKLSLHDLSAVVVSSYNKGFLTKEFIHFISSLCKLHNVPIWMDCKFILGEWSKNVTFCKINWKEYQENKKFHLAPEIFVENLIVTKGKDGCVWVNKNVCFPCEMIEVTDTQGLGDSFLAGFVVKYLETASVDEALILGNKVATLAATKRGTSVIFRAEIANT